MEVTERRPMNLIGGLARFWSVPERLTIYPLGPPHSQVVGTPQAPVVVPVPKPEVTFEAHRYNTEDPNLAAAMIRHTSYERTGGFVLEQGGLPETIREFWDRLNPAAKRKVALALISGQGEDEVFNLLTQDDIGKTAEPKGSPGFFLGCPVSNCGVRISDAGGEDVETIRASMAAHIRVMHPDWKGTE